MFTRGFLETLRSRAIRKRVLHKVLCHLDRGILYLSLRVSDSISNPVLVEQLSEIVSKLEASLKSGFTCFVESFGPRRVVTVVKQAVMLGCREATHWVMDRSFMVYLAFLDFNQPQGYKCV